jgi:hypothetical protein
MKTENWPRPTLGLVMGGEERNGRVSTPFGPLRVGLTTTHRTLDQQLEESLRCLEREVENLQSKYCEAYVTLMSVLEHLVRLGAITKSITIIDKEIDQK